MSANDKGVLRPEEDHPIIVTIIPCHNHGQYVRRAIESVHEQDYPGKVVIVVDDGSTDNSYEVLQNMLEHREIDYEDEDGYNVHVGRIGELPTIIAHSNKAFKQAAARNKAIKLGWNVSDMYCQLDADDMLLPGKLQKSFDVLAKDPTKVGLVYSDVMIYNQTLGTTTREYRLPYDRTLLEQSNIISNAPLISKMAIIKVGFYDEDLPPCEDWDLWLRITEHFTAVHIPEPLQQYTVTGQNCTFTVSEQMWSEQRGKVMTKLRDRSKNRING